MLKSLKKFGGLLFLYLVIFVGVVLISGRINNLNNKENIKSIVVYK